MSEYAQELALTTGFLGPLCLIVIAEAYHTIQHDGEWGIGIAQTIIGLAGIVMLCGCWIDCLLYNR